MHNSPPWNSNPPTPFVLYHCCSFPEVTYVAAFKRMGVSEGYIGGNRCQSVEKIKFYLVSRTKCTSLHLPDYLGDPWDEWVAWNWMNC